MKHDSDVFGRMLLEQYRNSKTPVHEIIERDDGLISASSAQKYFTTYPEWSTGERRAIGLAKGRTLDVGCGVGRHALYLQEKGLDVTGIDISKGAIVVCKKKGLKKAYAQDIENLWDFKDGSFDTVLMLYNNFGLLQNKTKAKNILKELCRITSPDGQIIANGSNPHATNDPLHKKYQLLNKKRGRMEGQLRIRLRFKKFKGEWFDYLLVSPQEIKNLLRGTGWEVKKLWTSKEKGYVAVIKKSKNSRQTMR